MRYVVLVLIVCILVALLSALVFLVKDRGRTNRTVHALALRVGLSIALFALLMISHRMGWIKTPLFG